MDRLDAYLAPDRGRNAPEVPAMLVRVGGIGGTR
jgi:hypothetical protein